MSSAIVSREAAAWAWHESARFRHKHALSPQQPDKNVVSSSWWVFADLGCLQKVVPSLHPLSNPATPAKPHPWGLTRTFWLGRWGWEGERGHLPRGVVEGAWVTARDGARGVTSKD